MRHKLDQIFERVSNAWRFRSAGFAVTFVLALLGWTVVFMLPDQYAADARVFVDTHTALEPALQGLSVDQNVDAQINYVRESLLEGPRLESIAKEAGVLSPAVVDERQKARLLDRFSDRIVLGVFNAGNRGDERSTAGTIYTFHYADHERNRALKVISVLVDTFVEQTLGGKREGSQQAQQFLAEQIKDYEHRLSAAEDRLAAFKKLNVGMMPSEQGGYFAQLQSETDAAKKAQTNLSIAVSRRDELARQLRSDVAVFAAGAALPPLGSRGAGSDTLSRIQEAQARLDELLLKFTDQHPDVIAARATLAELRQRRAIEVDSLRRGDASAVAASGAGNNPVYQNIQLELNRQEVEIAALRRQLAQHQATVAELRQRLNSAPQVEAEFQQLNRDYDVNKARYTALLESYQKASLGERADNAGSVRFEVVLPPTALATPVWPQRFLFLVGIFVVALASGAGTACLLDVLNPVVSSAAGLNALSALPVLGSVGEAFPGAYRDRARLGLLKVSAVAICLLAAFVVALGLNWAGVRLNLGAWDVWRQT